MTPQQARDTIDLFYGSPINIISDCLRGFIVARPGHDLIAVDFNAIEARVLAWLAGEEKVLNLFRQNQDVYSHAAAGIYGVAIDKVTPDQRQVGKVAILALGFGGGKRAFQAMARNYGVAVTDDEAEKIKTAWRIENPSITRYWANLERAALGAVLHPGQEHTVGTSGNQKNRAVTYKKVGSFLWCRLPSGRVLCYPFPEITPKRTPWGEMRDQITYMGEDSLSKKWVRMGAYGGLLAENVTQAVARDLLADALRRLEEWKYPVIFHVHDEAVVEVREGYGSVEDVERTTASVPYWAEGLPVEVKGWRGKRYRK